MLEILKQETRQIEAASGSTAMQAGPYGYDVSTYGPWPKKKEGFTRYVHVTGAISYDRLLNILKRGVYVSDPSLFYTFDPWESADLSKENRSKGYAVLIDVPEGIIKKAQEMSRGKGLHPNFGECLLDLITDAADDADGSFISERRSVRPQYITAAWDQTTGEWIYPNQAMKSDGRLDAARKFRQNAGVPFLGYEINALDKEDFEDKVAYLAMSKVRELLMGRQYQVLSYEEGMYLKNLFSLVAENLVHHEYTNLDKMYLRVYPIGKTVRVEFWGPAKEVLPEELTWQQWFSSNDRPWHGKSPVKTTGNGYGINDMFNLMDTMSFYGRVVPEGEHILVGWREAKADEGPNPKGHVIAFQVPVKMDKDIALEGKEADTAMDSQTVNADKYFSNHSVNRAMNAPITDPNEIFSLLTPELIGFVPSILELGEKFGVLTDTQKRALAIIRRFDMFSVHGNLIFDHITNKRHLDNRGIQFRKIKYH